MTSANKKQLAFGGGLGKLLGNDLTKQLLRMALMQMVAAAAGRELVINLGNGLDLVCMVRKPADPPPAAE